MSRAPARRGRGGKSQRPKPEPSQSLISPRPNASKDSSSGQRSGSILAEIKQHLSTTSTAPHREPERNTSSTSVKPSQRGRKPPSSASSDGASSSTDISFSSATSNSTRSSDTLVTNPYENSNATNSPTTSNDHSKSLCKITNISTGRCQNGSKCPRVHILEPEPEVDAKEEPPKITCIKTLPVRPPEPEELTLTLLQSTVVTIGRGLQVLKVVTSFESNMVVLGNLPAVISESDVRNIGEPFGKILSVECRQLQSPKVSSVAKLVYSSSSEAAAAIAELNGSMQFFAKITAQPYHVDRAEVGRLRANLVRVDIPAPGMVVFTGYETSENAEKVVAAMHGTTINNHVVAAHIHNGMPKAGIFTVKIEGLPYQTSEKKIRAFGGVRSKPTPGDILFKDPVYRSNLVDVIYVLQNVLEEHGNLISLDFARTVPRNGRISGIARFASAAGAAAACSSLYGRKFVFLGNEKIYLTHLHKLVYKIPPAIHRALLPELRRLMEFARAQPGVQLSYTYNEKNVLGNVEIDLTATHLDSLKRVKAPLERVIAGETLVDQRKPVWDNFFSTASGCSFLASVSRRTGAYIRPHHIRCFVKIWGSRTSITAARDILLNEVKQLRSKKSHALPLNGQLLKQILFNGLDPIYEQVEKDDVFVDFEARKLVIRGTEKQFRWAVDTLSKLSAPKPADGQQSADASGGQQACPICLDSVVEGITLDCGHCACRECLTRYLVSASDHKTFPLKCLGNENQCTELLPLSLCKRLLEKEQFARLVDASFFTYIQTRPQEFHYCPTPDCPQVYRDAPGTTLQCPTCLVSICPTCHAVQHDGVECRVTSKAGEKLFNEWREQHNVKTCPRCSANIEKDAGCNHLMCTSCSTHICWECMQTFKESGEVYEHMVRAHGGIGL